MSTFILQFAWPACVLATCAIAIFTLHHGVRSLPYAYEKPARLAIVLLIVFVALPVGLRLVSTALALAKVTP